MITISTESPGGEPPPVTRQQITRAATAVLSAEKITDARLAVIFADDEYLRKMKLRYFSKDVYTDVIAFNLNEPENELEGEVYISLDRAQENSSRYSVTLEAELLRLVIHGTLHLLGFEDTSREKKQIMRRLEDRYLADIVPRP